MKEESEFELEVLNNLVFETENQSDSRKRLFLANLSFFGSLIAGCLSYFLFRIEIVSSFIGVLLITVFSFYCGLSVYYISFLKKLEYIKNHLNTESLTRRINEIKT